MHKDEHEIAMENQIHSRTDDTLQSSYPQSLYFKWHLEFVSINISDALKMGANLATFCFFSGTYNFFLFENISRWDRTL